jgi:dTDP-D-glucose 4,6-dehydratase
LKKIIITGLMYVSDIAKCKQELRWQPKVSWTAGVKRLLLWVVDNKKMLQDVLVGQEAAEVSIR